MTCSFVPGGGDVKIESQKLNFKEKAQAKVGSLDNVGHLPAGGAVKVVSEPPVHSQSGVSPLQLDQGLAGLSPPLSVFSSHMFSCAIAVSISTVSPKGGREGGEPQPPQLVADSAPKSCGLPHWAHPIHFRGSVGWSAKDRASWGSAVLDSHFQLLRTGCWCCPAQTLEECESRGQLLPYLTLAGPLLFAPSLLSPSSLLSLPPLSTLL